MIRDRVKITLKKIIDPMLPLRILATEYSLNAIFRPIKGSWDIIRLHTQSELLEVGELEQSMELENRIGVAYNQWIWTDQ